MHNTITFLIQKDHINSFLNGNSVLFYGRNNTTTSLITFTYNVNDVKISGGAGDSAIFIKLVQHNHFSSGPL